MATIEREDIPLPDEVDAEEESPFRRRQKVVQVRRSRFARIRRLARWGLLAALLLVPVGYGAYRLAFFLLTSPRFMLTSADDVAITGNHIVTREEILGALGLSASGSLRARLNILHLSLEEKKQQVESIPWIESATLARGYPHRLLVKVAERTPVAFVNIDGRVKLVDGEGVLLDLPEKADFNFPVLTGLQEAGDAGARQARLDLYLRFARELAEDAPRSGWLISEVDLSDPDDLKAILAQGNETLQVHFGHDLFGQRFRDFLTLVPELRRNNTRIDSVDLRYRNQVVVNPQSPAGRPGDAAASGGSETRKD